MRHAPTGVLHGRTIELAESDLDFEGLRDRVLLEELIQDELVLSPAENAQLLKERAAKGPQGPIDDARSAEDRLVLGPGSPKYQRPLNS